MSLPFILPDSCDINVSFEFFPPKTEKMKKTLWESIEILKPLKPKFISVTYGAGGSTRNRTHEIVTSINKRTGLNAAAHLTCIGASRGEIDDIARRYWDGGIKHIVALRGDLPKDYIPVKDSYNHANELVAGLKRIADFEISVAGYPEKHPEAQDIETDIDNLKRKIDAGADRIISQFFIEPKVFLYFCDKAKAAGINVPIIPGILPITNFKKTVEFAYNCNASIPDWLIALFKDLDIQKKTRKLVAAMVAAEQCKTLYDNGIKDFHFYTINRAELTMAICHMLGLRNK